MDAMGRNRYQRYQAEGYDGLAHRGHQLQQFWSKIPQQVRNDIVELVLIEPE